MSKHRRKLIVTLGSFWLSGSGARRGFDVDAEAVVDGDGLPYLPGKHLRGLLRDAAQSAEAGGFAIAPDADGGRRVLPKGATEVLFGVGGLNASYGASAGLLEVRDARLPGDISAWLRASCTDPACLFRSLHQTAMDEKRGVAKSASLRVTEAAIPMRLEGEVALVPWAEKTAREGLAVELRESWAEIVEALLPLVGAVGQGRHHGLGRAFLKLEPAP